MSPQHNLALEVKSKLESGPVALVFETDASSEIPAGVEANGVANMLRTFFKRLGKSVKTRIKGNRHKATLVIGEK